MSVLLRQAHGFEGLIRGREALKSDTESVAEGVNLEIGIPRELDQR